MRKYVELWLNCPACEHAIRLHAYSEDGNVTQVDPKKPRAPRPRGAIPELAGWLGVDAALHGVLHSVQERWIMLYKDPEWIKREIVKSQNWAALKKRRISDWGRFINNWLGTAYRDAGQDQGPVSQEKGLDLEA